MVTLNAREEIPPDQVHNEPHQHAFIMVGKNQLFGVHMTQYHCELHKYQIILKLKLPDKIYKQYLELLEAHPGDSFVLCNAKNYKGQPRGETRSFSIPDLGSTYVKSFTANIFQGIRPLSEMEIAADTHFFPWAKKYVKAAIPEFKVEVERIVTFRPFDHLETLPKYAKYLIWGSALYDEVHMTNLQTAMMVTDAFEPQVFGPDYDHVMSIERPEWLQQDAAMLEAGLVVTTPSVQLVDGDSGLPTIPEKSPFAAGSQIEVLYRGIGPTRSVTAGPTFLYATGVCNSPRFFMPRPEHDNYLRYLPEVKDVMEFSLMPKRYWAFPEDD